MTIIVVVYVRLHSTSATGSTGTAWHMVGSSVTKPVPPLERWVARRLVGLKTKPR